MALPDNRMRFPPSLIDFATDIGETGQDHDTYPDPGQQLRFDWQRCVFIALLSNQASYSAPVNYRKGSFWFDLNTNVLKIRTGDGVAGTLWTDIPASIELSPGLTVKDWFDVVSASLADRIVRTPELIAALQNFFTADISGNIQSIVMASPSGNRYRITINDSGHLVSTLIV